MQINEKLNGKGRINLRHSNKFVRLYSISSHMPMLCTRIVLFVLCISQVCVRAGEISLPQKPIAVTIDFVDVRILNSRDAFFEAEFVFVYEWEDETVDQDTPLEEIIIPPIVPGNKVRNRKVYADKVIVLENSIQRIVREVCDISVIL